MFYSPLFDFGIPHRFALTKLMRQSEDDKLFLSAIADIRKGQCSISSQQYLSSLDRVLPEALQEVATHIFFRKVPVQLSNRRELDALPGELLAFEASFENDCSKSMCWPGATVLHLKRGCKVMLVWNKSHDLKNGSLGTFTGEKGDVLLVAFDGVGIVEISRETWIKRNKNGNKIGSVTQFPVVLAYAVKCHKSQGLTLAAAVVHCSREYVPGLIYVAVSRVKSPECIQILNFNSRQLLKPQQKAVDMCSTHHTCAPVADRSCCCKKSFSDNNLLSVTDRCDAECAEEDDESFTFPSEFLDGPVRACFEDEDVDVQLELLDIYDRFTRHESSLSSPSDECFNKCREHLLAMKTSPCSVVSSFMAEKNAAIDFLLTDTCWTKVLPFIELVWFHSFLIIENHIVEHPEEIVINISRQGFTEATSRLHEFFTSTEFSQYVCIVFGVSEVTHPQRSVAIEVAKFIYWEFLEALVSVVRQDRMDGVDFNVEEMDVVGRSKVRHVGGWAVRKILTRARNYTQKHVYTNYSSTLAKVETKQRVCELLEENVIQSFDQLQETSAFQETLQVTEARQYRQRGLLHISDNAYLFFMKLEQRRVQLLNVRVLKKERDNMIEAAIRTLLMDEDLHERWLRCFSKDDVEKSKVFV